MQKRPRGEIKFAPGSFVVQELVLTHGQQIVVPLFNESCIHGWDGIAPVTLFHLTKTGLSTEQAVGCVSRELEVPKGVISYHGLKDRHALTAQCLAVEGSFRPKFRHHAIYLKQVGIAHRRLGLGGNAGNRFTIEVMSATECVETEQLICVPNLFGLQRVASRQDGEVGRLLLEGNFAGAAQMLPPRRSDFHDLCRAYEQTKDWELAWKHCSMEFAFGFNVLKWRSWLWNELLRRSNQRTCPPKRLPMWAPEHARLYKEIWEPENLDESVAASMHRFDRETFVRPKNISVERIRVGWRVCFDLPSGAYATTTLSQIFELVEQSRY